MDYGFVLGSLSNLGDEQVPPLGNGEPKHGPSYANFCQAHAVRFAHRDNRWLASQTSDCSAVTDLLLLNRTLAAYFQRCIPGPGEKSFLGFRGLHAALFVDMERAESFFLLPSPRKLRPSYATCGKALNDEVRISCTRD